MSNFFCDEIGNNNYVSDYMLEGGFSKDKQYMADLVNSTNDFTENNRMPVIPPNHYSEDNEDENLLSINDDNKNILFLEEIKHNNMDIDTNTFITHNNMENFDVEENHFKQQTEKKKQDLIKRKQGRKKKDEDRSNIIHSNSAKDNVIYKLKVQSMKCIYDILLGKINKKSSKKVKLNKIVGNLLKEGKRNYNLDFFKKTIREILLMEKSKRHKSNKIPDNKNTIELYESDIKEILDMIYVDFVQDIFMKLSKEELKERYGVISEHLFKTIELNEQQKKTMKDLTGIGILEYYKNIKPRKRTIKNSIQE